MIEYFISVATEEETGAIELLDHRIVGGRNASICDYPYQVSVQYLGRHICGGAIIGPKWVITTARCLVKLVVTIYLNSLLTEKHILD